MASSSRTSLHRAPARRLRFGTLARRCVGSMILLAGASILTLDMMALLAGGNAGPRPSPPAIERPQAL